MFTPARIGFGLTVIALVGLAVPRDARAQAWVPARGEGAIALSFQNTNVTKHLASTTRVDAGAIDTNVLIADVSYGISDKVAVDLALPFVSSKYTGNRPHPGTDIDDGTYRGSFTDVRFAIRYNLTREGAVITPYFGSVVPSHSYAFYGHAAPGQNLREVQVGVYGAKLFERGLPGLFISGRYGYGFVEKILDISHNRSSADLEVGYFFTSSFRAFGMANGQYSHGGIDFPVNGLAGLPVELRPVHDVIQKVHSLDLGAGAAYSITDSFDVFGSFSRLVAGRNGHALNRGITVGASWSFARKRKSPDVLPASAPDALIAKHEGTLLRCVCQK